MRRWLPVLFLALAACGGDAGDAGGRADPWEQAREAFPTPAIPWAPQTYACPRVEGRIELDGRLDDAAWANAPWTRAFVDIQGDARPTPRFTTRVKMLWDDEHFYVAADLEEPHLQASLTKRDSYIFHDDNDFEIFLDPDADTAGYMELEVNAFGTEWDLILERAYRDGGPARDDWNMPGVRTVTWHDGTISVEGASGGGPSSSLSVLMRRRRPVPDRPQYQPL